MTVSLLSATLRGEAGIDITPPAGGGSRVYRCHTHDDRMLRDAGDTDAQGSQGVTRDCRQLRHLAGTPGGR